MLGKIMKALWPASIPLRREPLPPLSAADQALAEEETGVSVDEVELALAAIRAHAQARKVPRTGPDPLLFQLALQQAEAFAQECLNFDRAMTKASRIDRAFTIWARQQRFHAVAESDFARAMEVVLAWSGGHRAIRQGVAVYIGCALKPEIAESLGKPGYLSNPRRGAGVTIDHALPE